MLSPYRVSAPCAAPPFDADVARAAARFAEHRRRAVAAGLGALAVPLLAALCLLYWWFVIPPCGFRCM